MKRNVAICLVGEMNDAESDWPSILQYTFEILIGKLEKIIDCNEFWDNLFKKKPYPESYRNLCTKLTETLI